MSEKKRLVARFYKREVFNVHFDSELDPAILSADRMLAESAISGSDFFSTEVIASEKILEEVSDAPPGETIDTVETGDIKLVLSRSGVNYQIFLNRGEESERLLHVKDLEQAKEYFSVCRRTLWLARAPR